MCPSVTLFNSLTGRLRNYYASCGLTHHSPVLSPVHSPVHGPRVPHHAPSIVKLTTKRCTGVPGSDVTGSSKKSAAGKRRKEEEAHFTPSSHSSSSHLVCRLGLPAQGRSILHLTERVNFIKRVDFN